MALDKVFLLILVSSLVAHVHLQKVVVEKDGVCADRPSHFANCPSWARRGWCQPGYRYSFFARLSCRKTCQLCHGESGCFDKFIECRSRRSYCKHGSPYRRFMVNNCKETCQLCH